MSPPDVPWTTLTNGYRTFHDPRGLISRLRKGGALKRCWDEIFDKMHHQGDVGTASYALVPVLVDVYTARPRTWEIYSYIATLEEAREENHNPDLPDWLQDDYDHALVRLRELAFEDLRMPQRAGMLRSRPIEACPAISCEWSLRRGPLVCRARNWWAYPTPAETFGRSHQISYPQPTVARTR